MTISSLLNLALPRCRFGLHAQFAAAVGRTSGSTETESSGWVTSVGVNETGEAEITGLPPWAKAGGPVERSQVTTMELPDPRGAPRCAPSSPL